jgi:hypothetical protein
MMHGPLNVRHICYVLCGVELRAFGFDRLLVVLTTG